MNDATLRFVRRKDCSVSLPKEKLSSVNHSIDKKQGCILISIASIGRSNDCALHVCWDGRATSAASNCIEIDSDFATANNFKDGENVVFKFEPQPKACISFKLAAVDNDETEMLETKLTSIEASLLSYVRVVRQNLIVPIWLSANVRVLARVVEVVAPGLSTNNGHKDDDYIVELTNRTELQIVGNLLSDDFVEFGGDESTEADSLSDVELAFLDVALNFRQSRDLQWKPFLVCGARGSGKTHFLHNIKRHYSKSVNSFFCNFQHLLDAKPDTVKKQLLMLAQRAIESQPSLLFIENVDLLVAQNSLQEGQKGFETVKSSCYANAVCQLVKYFERATKECSSTLQDESANRVVMLAPKVAVVMTSTLNYEALHTKLAASTIGAKKFASFVKVLSEPNQKTRKQIFINSLKTGNFELSGINDEMLNEIATKTESFSPLDIKQVIQSSIVSRKTIANGECEPVVCAKEILDTIYNYVPFNLRSTKLQPKTNNTFASIGGMKAAKRLLTKIILYPLRYSSLIKQAPFRTQTHVLLYGPSGCGKTTLAEAVANEQKMNFFSIKGPELLSKYIGGSEAAVRDLFERAEKATPCIVLFDEFDSIAPQRGHDSTGVTDRVVNQMLTMINGTKPLKEGLHIIATTSRRDMIDAALLRPGRLDCHILCDYPDYDGRLEILQLLSQGIEFAASVDMKRWAHRLEHFSGADIRSLLYTAQLKALRKTLATNASKGELRVEKNEVDMKVDSVDLELAFLDVSLGVEQRYRIYIRNLKGQTVFQRDFPAAEQIIQRATLA